jgi:starch-binding outer membrane protein, SusD/RagB family
MIAHGKNFQDKHYLYPIPLSEIDASAGTLTQNPGY